MTDHKIKQFKSPIKFCGEINITLSHKKVHLILDFLLVQKYYSTIISKHFVVTHSMMITKSGDTVFCVHIISNVIEDIEGISLSNISFMF